MQARFRVCETLCAGLALSGLLGATVFGSMVPIPGDPVTTSSGKIAGTRLSSGVKAYLGIPYAKPPVDDLRWRPPEPVSWNGVWNADRKGAECIQVLRPHNINNYFGEEATSEDCLNLNLWAPAAAKAGAKLPVIVFIYGGGGTIGSAGMANYDGEEVAKHGAIYVDFNYRVGTFGYLAHPELTKEQGGHSGNYGYLDQSFALRWIHDNIAAFGGDPAKVVLMGQSFGAGSVAAQIFSPLSKGLFRGAVMSSGCNFTSRAPTLEVGEKVGLELQKALNASSLADMRQVPADRILALQAESQVGANVRGVRTSGVLDGYFWTMPKDKAFETHTNSDVPVIASFNNQDNDAGMNPLAHVKTVAEFHEAATKLYGPNAAEFLRLYPAATDAEAAEMGLRAAHEAGFEGASRTCAELQAKYDKSATYIDLYSRKHPYLPGVKIADQDTATVGAYHSGDVPYWFDTLDKYNSLRPTRNWTAWDRELSERMLGALIAFANTGSPSTAQMKWPAWSAADEEEIVFGDTITLRKLNPERIKWLADHPAARIAPTGPPRTGPRD